MDEVKDLEAAHAELRRHYEGLHEQYHARQVKLDEWIQKCADLQRAHAAEISSLKDEHARQLQANNDIYVRLQNAEHEKHQRELAAERAKRKPAEDAKSA